MTGTITRLEGGTATVNLGKVEGLLPRGEQIPGESHRVGERVRAVVIDVRKAGSRVRIILSRTHPEMVRRLFEIEIPEVQERIIEVRSLAREAGYRSKVAVSCYDSKIDCVGACVGVRGSRIKNVVEELAGERIDIVRWNDSLQVLVPNALQPAEVEEVILCPMLGKVIVLVQDDQLSLAIGKKGQNVRLASKLVGWDIHVMNQKKLDEQLNKSVGMFSASPRRERRAGGEPGRAGILYVRRSVGDRAGPAGRVGRAHAGAVRDHCGPCGLGIGPHRGGGTPRHRRRAAETARAAWWRKQALRPRRPLQSPLWNRRRRAKSPTTRPGVEDASARKRLKRPPAATARRASPPRPMRKKATNQRPVNRWPRTRRRCESPLDEPGATEHAVEVTQGRNVEQEAAKVPQRANGEQSPSLETAALDDQAEE